MRRSFRKPLNGEPLLSPNRIGTDGANTLPSTIKAAVDDGLLHPDLVHSVTKHLQQGIESDRARIKKNMPKIGGFQSCNTARPTIAGQAPFKAWPNAEPASRLSSTGRPR